MKNSASNTKDATGDAAQQIDARIASLDGWRGKTLAKLRTLILAADPGIVEQWKWDVPVWSHGGILCTGEAYKAAIKLTFAKGASLPDPKRLFNSSLEGNTRRAIDVREHDSIDGDALKALIRAAVALNAAGKPAKKAAVEKVAVKKTAAKKAGAKKPTAAKRK